MTDAIGFWARCGWYGRKHYFPTDETPVPSIYGSTSIYTLTVPSRPICNLDYTWFHVGTIIKSPDFLRNRSLCANCLRIILKEK